MDFFSPEIKSALTSNSGKHRETQNQTFLNICSTIDMIVPITVSCHESLNWPIFPANLHEIKKHWAEVGGGG